MSVIHRFDEHLGPLSIGQCFALATIMEATAPKPGNVHRGADFEDCSYPDFIVAATLVVPLMDLAVELPLGQTVLASIVTTRQAVCTNTNLGTVLLVAPLAKVPRASDLRSGVADVLRDLTPQDARDVYDAIRLANPGGLGRAETADVAGEPPADLVGAMRLAAERDRVARQYACDFEDVFETVVPALARGIAAGWTLAETIVRVHLEIMSRFPDSLIARRRGVDVAGQSALRAGAVLDSGGPRDEAYLRGLAEFDFWLRADGHARNPGTTADLLAAGLFVALRDAIIKPPFRLANLD